MNTTKMKATWAGLRLGCAVMLPAIAGTAAVAGTVTGVVANAGTGALLEGATVAIPAIGRQELTDVTGRYTFNELAPGTYTVEVSYTGLDVGRRSLVVPGEGSATLNVDLSTAVYQLEAFKVAGVREGNAASITQQRNAPNVKSVVALDAFGNLANENPGELLVRLAGVAPRVTDDGDVFAVYVRGIDSNLSSVTIDGSKMVTSGPLNREFRFLNISAGFFDELEVTKSPTPDMDADSLGGAVNMKTKSTLGMKEKRLFTYRIGAKWAAPLWDQIPIRKEHPIQPSTSLGYQEVFDIGGGKRTLGVALNAFYIENATAFSSTIRDYAFSLNDPAYVYDYRTTDGYNVRTQRSVTAKVDYQLTPATRVTVSGMINDAFEELGKSFNTRITTSRTVGTTGTTGILTGFSNLITEGRPVAASIFSVTSGSSGFLDRQRRAQLDVEHKLSSLVLDGTLSFSRSKVAQDSGYGGHDKNSGSFVADVRSVGWRLDQTQSREYPRFTQVSGASILDPRSYGAGQLSQSNNGRFGRVLLAGGNATYKLPIETPSSIKAGVRWRQQESQEVGGNRRWNYAGPDGVVGNVGGRNDDSLAEFRDTHGTIITPEYGLGGVPFFHVGTIAQHLKDNPRQWVEDRYFGEMQKYAGTDGVTEEVTAGYLMGRTKLGALGVLAGARVEQTEISGYGYVAPRTFPTISDPVVRAATEYGGRRKISGEYTDVFPGAHLAYDLTKGLKARASASTSVGRPAFSALVPREDLNTTALTVTINNPALKPQYSKNYDASLEYYFEPVGLVSAGVFQKDITDFIYTDSGGVVGTGVNNGYNGQYAGYTIIRQANGGGARVRGLELSYQQQFTFLPGWMRGLGGFANYTRLLTQGDYGSGVSGSANQVQRFVPKTANAGISYGYRRLKTRLMVNYVGEHLFTYSSDPSRLLYKEARKVTSLSVSYTLWRWLDAYADCNNLLHATQRYYRGLGKTDRLATLTDNAPTIGFGVSGKF